MATSVALSNLIIHPANKQQRVEVIKHVTNHWGSPEAGLDHFVRVHDIIENKEFGKDGKLTHWVLVPQDDRGTLDFYSCCRTYRRDIVVLHAGSDAQQTAIGYVVSGVVTPPNHRRRGYAQRMVSLLHYALAPTVHSSPDINIEIPPSVLPATVAVLYSDIGNYYSRCGPPGSPGLTITSPITTRWNHASSIPKLRDHTFSSAPVELLSEEAVHELLKSDIPDLASLPRSQDKTYFAFAPTFPLNLYLVTDSAIHPLHNKLPEVHWGARSPDGNSFVTWSFDYYSSRALQITRLQADPASLPALLLAAFREGELQGCGEAEAWNVSEELKEIVAAIGGTTGDRRGHLPAMLWYGPRKNEDIVWSMNE